MKQGLGALFAAGHDLSLLERYSWDQIALMAECLGMHHTRMFDVLLAPVAAFMGKGYKPASAPKSGSKPTSVDYSDPASVKRAKERDARILIGAGGILGVKVEM